MTAPQRRRVRVSGVVQGVGFRPHVYALARQHHLSGFVGNDVDGVFIEIEGAGVQLDDFLRALQHQPPPLATIEHITSSAMDVQGSAGFVIAASEGAGPRRTLVAADSATCRDCLSELTDPTDRRYGYPFINCTNCGPRFTIVADIPYDRANTTMAGFAMCADCEREYHDPADRRFHAQPVCCPACGPELQLIDPAGDPVPGDPLQATAALLRSGHVVAIKGLGGYHLAADATSEPACSALRSRKHREDKAFAVMAPAGADGNDLAEVARLCLPDPAAERELIGRRRPIVLLQRRADSPTDDVAPSVAPGTNRLGVMLPYTPLHHLLLTAVARPIVLTSGNLSDEPIAYRDDDALQRLAPIAEAFLTHNRGIHVRTDDSVMRISRGEIQPLRRSRGYSPEPVELSTPATRPVLACGAEQKNTFCLAHGAHAFVSHHIGDLENLATLESFTAGIEHFQRLFEIAPELVVHDMHPDYLSTKHALAMTGVERISVQHHHAHIASCLADNQEQGPVIGVAFDGTGFGPDGTVWGGEFLVADCADFRREAHLRPVPMPGGAAAIRHPWRMAVSYLDAAFDGNLPAGLALRTRNAAQWDQVRAIGGGRLNAPETSSMGRLFDAVAAVLGVRDSVSYEGQAAVELEQLAARAGRAGKAPYPVAATDGQVRILHGPELVRAVAEDLHAGTDQAVIAARFHAGVAACIAETATALAERTGLDTVALSGGVFCNALLEELTLGRLHRAGLRVLTHHRVPCNDGGISLGQVAIAAARDQRGPATSRATMTDRPPWSPRAAAPPPAG